MPTRQDICTAAYIGDTARLRQLIAEGADVNEKSESGETPLNEVILELCGWGEPFRYEVISTLLSLGADPNILCDDGNGPLTWAMLRMDIPMMRMLLEAGAAPNKPSGSSDLETLYDWGDSDYDLVHRLSFLDLPTDDEKNNEDLRLAFLDRMAIKYNFCRPEHLLLLRSYGAKTFNELEKLNL